jgi:hypothetical protein
MAHFAKIDDSGLVLDIIVVRNEDILDASGLEQEAIGVDLCVSLFGGNWVQTSYNNRFRKQYARIGGRYLKKEDVFIDPRPNPDWVLDNNFDWVEPK